MPEAARWTRADRRGDTRRARVSDLFAAQYRARTTGSLAAALLLDVATAAVQVWVFYVPVRLFGIAEGEVTAIVLGGGLVGLSGYRLGARLADRWGRRRTFAVATVAATSGGVAYYTAAAEHGPLVLGIAFGFTMLTSTASLVAFRSTVTELFPTALRGTLQGALMTSQALAGVIANFSAAALAATVGGLAPAIGLLALLGLGAVAAFLTLLPETAGLSLDQASLEGADEPVVARLAMDGEGGHP
jgi:MFS family permease